MEDCIFCKIVKKEVPSDIIYEDDKVFAFLDSNPVNFGHTLVIPKEHFKYMHDTPDDLVAQVFIEAKKLAEIIKKATKADFVAVSVVGRDVPHFHVHLVPRYSKDGLENFWPTKKYMEGESKEVAGKIRKLVQ